MILRVGGEEVCEVCADVLGCGAGIPAGHGLSLRIDEELLKVPLHVGRVTIAGLVSLHHRVEGSLGIAIDINLGKHREIDVVVRARELGDLFVGAGFLTPELVTRKAENIQAIDFVVESTQTCVLRSRSSFTRNIDSEDILAFEL